MPRSGSLIAGLMFALASCSDGDATAPAADPAASPPAAPPPTSVTGTPVRASRLAAPALPAAPSLPSARASSRRAPPLSGGTLIVLRDGRTAVAADPDFDRVYVADLTAMSLRGYVQLVPGDEPGRLVEDGAGRVHVALRRGGAVATIDPATVTLTGQRAVCPAPRGLTRDAAGESLYVACAGGELVTLPAAGGDATRTVRLPRDLRDVLAVGAELWVSRFRSAEVLVLDASGAVLRTMRPALRTGDSEPSTAWRMIPYREGALMVHQRAGAVPAATPMYYAANPACESGIVSTEVTVFMPDAAPVTSPPVRNAVLPLDVTVTGSTTGSEAFTIVAPGHVRTAIQVLALPRAEISASSACVGTERRGPSSNAQLVAVAARGDDLVYQEREPAALSLGTGARILLSDLRVDDRGHALFHEATVQHIACASCHPEAGDDGHVWRLLGEGLRRTPDLRGGLLATAPFHWDGSLRTMSSLVAEVMVRRMGRDAPNDAQVDAMAGWIHAQTRPAPSPPVDAAAVARGRAVFERDDVGCAGCHSGALMTNNDTVDVGTGAAFQVPSLRGVGGRAPYMHDGCAPTLRSRFGACGGGDRHGHTSQLDAAAVSDLAAYLESL